MNFFPATTSLRLERMALAIFTALLSLALALQFGSLFMQTLQTLLPFSQISHKDLLRLASILSASCIFIFFTLAYSCFTLIKIHPINKEKNISIYNKIRISGIFSIFTAIGFSILCLLANLAIEVLY